MPYAILVRTNREHSGTYIVRECSAIKSQAISHFGRALANAMMQPRLGIVEIVLADMSQARTKNTLINEREFFKIRGITFEGKT